LIEILRGTTNEILFHQKCFDYYTHPKSLAKFKENIVIEETDNSENAVETPKRSARKRDRFGEFR